MDARIDNDRFEELRRRLEAVEAADRAKSKFLAEVSHEIRTQLAGVIGMTQVTLDTKLTPEQREYLELVVQSGDALLTLVNDLLDMSKIEAGKIEIEAVPFSLPDLVKAAVSSLRAVAEAKGLELVAELDVNLPEGVVGDPGRIRQVLLNLVNNAIKFTEAGGIVVSVKAEAVADETAEVHFEVIDSGPGITDEEQRRIFEPFEQGDHAPIDGTGLGLTITRRLVGFMGGRIWVESDPGRGSIFHVVLPFDLTDLEPHLPRARSEFTGVPALVVAAQAINRDHLMHATEAIGLDVVGVSSMTEAIGAIGVAAAADRPFAIALLELPGNVLDIAAQLRKRPGLDQMHIVVVTSLGQRGDAARCRALNIAGYFSRPVPDRDLQEGIAAVLAGPAPGDLTRLVTKHWLRERRRHLNVLVVDDSPTHRMIAKRVLERRGHHVEDVDNGRAAQELVLKHSFDVILMDLWMPDVNGLIATEGIRGFETGGRRVPIIGLAPEGIAGVEEQARRAGMDAVVSKPFDIDALLRVIDRTVPTS